MNSTLDGSEVRMGLIPKQTDRKTSNLIFRSNMVSRIDAWNLNWVLPLEIKKLLHFLTQRSTPKITIFKNNYVRHKPMTNSTFLVSHHCTDGVDRMFSLFYLQILNKIFLKNSKICHSFKNKLLCSSFHEKKRFSLILDENPHLFIYFFLNTILNVTFVLY